jgi:hypothetical protein
MKATAGLLTRAKWWVTGMPDLDLDPIDRDHGERPRIDHPKHDYLAPHGGRRGMGGVLVRAFGCTVPARYLDNSEEMVREQCSHIEAGEFGDVATEALDEIDS